MIIAIRNLTSMSSEGEKRIDVSIHAPELQDGMWMCRYRIEWPSQNGESFAAGVDAVQPLYLALQKIGMEPYVSPYHLSGDLRWEKSGDGYGFPVPKNGRDRLTGADRSFDG